MCVSNKRLKIEFAATRKTPCNKLSEQDSHPRKSLLNRYVVILLKREDCVLFEYKELLSTTLYV